MWWNLCLQAGKQEEAELYYKYAMRVSWLGVLIFESVFKVGLWKVTNSFFTHEWCSEIYIDKVLRNKGKGKTYEY